MIFKKFKGQVAASLVGVNVIMKRGRPSLDGEDDNATPLHKHTTYFKTPRLKNTIFNNGRYTTHIPTNRAPHSHYNRHKN